MPRKEEYRKNKEKIREYANKKYRENLFVSRLKQRLNYKKNILYRRKWRNEYRKKNLEHHKERQRLHRLKIKEEVFEHYGKRCNCCSEKNTLFLTVDHKNNDGNIMRRSFGYSRDTFAWARYKKFPDYLQILCWNCNKGKHLNDGICPHKSEVVKS